MKFSGPMKIIEIKINLGKRKGFFYNMIVNFLNHLIMDP